MLNRTFVTIYGIIGLVVIAVLLVLVWFRLVPTSYYLPLFLVALVIWAGRLVMRVILSRRERRESAGTAEAEPSKTGLHNE